MTRLGAVFWGGLVLASGFATFNVKYAVQGIEDELARVRRQTLTDQQEIRVLDAEWASLNHPERLAELNRTFLQLAPLTAKQLQGRVDEIALRTPSATLSETVTAANPPAAAPSAASPPAMTLAAATVALPPPAAAPARPGATPTGKVPAGAAPIGAIPAAETWTKPPVGGERAAAARDVEAAGAGTQLADAAGAAPPDATAAETAALAEARRLLGADAGAPAARIRPAKAALAAARTGEPHEAAAREAEAPAAEASQGRTGALAKALYVLGADAGLQGRRVWMAKASPASLDALISTIADTR